MPLAMLGLIDPAKATHYFTYSPDQHKVTDKESQQLINMPRGSALDATQSIFGADCFSPGPPGSLAFLYTAGRGLAVIRRWASVKCCHPSTTICNRSIFTSYTAQYMHLVLACPTSLHSHPNPPHLTKRGDPSITPLRTPEQLLLSNQSADGSLHVLLLRPKDLTTFRHFAPLACDSSVSLHTPTKSIFSAAAQVPIGHNHGHGHHH